MHTRLLLGPSGTGKTFRCLAEVRSALVESPEGPPLLFLAPKQATFQLERQLLSGPELAGYTRLQILSFERLAEFVLAQFTAAMPRLLSEEGRLMVLRALLAQKRTELRVFHATARLRGFAQELSNVLREVLRAQLSAAKLRGLTERAGSAARLDAKLHDLATLLEAYQNWLDQHRLQDQDRLLSNAAEVLRHAQISPGRDRERPHAKSLPQLAEAPGNGAQSSGEAIRIAGLWLDGFAQMSAQEIDLLITLLPLCDRATIAFNLDRKSMGESSWLNTWSVVGQTFQQVWERLQMRPEVETSIEWLERGQTCHRFAQNPVLRHLEEHWFQSEPFKSERSEHTRESLSARCSDHLRIVACPTREAEAEFAAREIRRFLRSGGRLREAAVLARRLDPYFDPIRRAFAAYDIPLFLDRREPVGHHPLAELTRSALRTLAFQWQTSDWFSALKTGLVHDNEAEIDRLENEALARGWKGKDWERPLRIPNDVALEKWAESLRQRLAAPMQKLGRALEPHASGERMAEALLSFWRELRVGEQLERWTTESGDAVHWTLWEQMQLWLKDIGLAFSTELLALRDWLPIIEAGLENQTVGVIPPALDQVLVGSVDRSRHPDLRLALVLGMNDSVFPAASEAPALLSESDRERLLELQVKIGLSQRERLGQERYLGYIACTRARERLVVTYASRDENDRTLNPSVFIAELQRLFPDLQTEALELRPSLAQADHPKDLLAPILLASTNPLERRRATAPLTDVPAVAGLFERLEQMGSLRCDEQLSPEFAEMLYGKDLMTSVSRIEDFAACPFKFFISSGLRAEERRHYELDLREQGSFLHEALALFHRTLANQGKRWRDLAPQQARAYIAEAVASLTAGYREGLLMADGQSLFTARSLTLALQDFIETVTSWMEQYEFDPATVELGFGQSADPLPAWKLRLDEHHQLLFRGKIDRVDLWRRAGGKEALGIVIDYKSNTRKLDSVLLAHGIQLQLAAYLSVLRGLPEVATLFGVARIVPAGLFYVNLRGRYENGRTRAAVLEMASHARRLAYKHTGRFDAAVVRQLDRRDVPEGDQFNYSFNQNGELSKVSREALDSAAFQQMLEAVETHLVKMGQAIFAGSTTVDPYRKGIATACDECQYQGICRIDPWTHVYRTLKKTGP